MPSTDYLRLMLWGYLLTIAVETVVLLVGLSRRHPIRNRLFAGVWLTACTYPVVWLVLPPLIENRGWYLFVAETFAPAAECVLFWFAFIRSRPDPSPNPSPKRGGESPPSLVGKGAGGLGSSSATFRDFITITVANLCSFGLGELIYYTDLWSPGD